MRADQEDRVFTDPLDEEPEHLLALPQTFLRGAALREVSRHLAKPAKLATRGVEQRGNNDIGPKRGAVFAHAPPFVRDAAFGDRALEFLLRLSRFDILRRIEAREMRADDLAGEVAFDPLRSLVPRLDIAFRIEGEDAVILDALDEQAKPLLGCLWLGH